jgi:hypothetical protein
MKREDFIFTIGYSGDTALVDGRARKEYAGLSVSELIGKGLWRAAFCAALFDDKREDMDLVVSKYNEKSGASLKSIQDMKRMLGVYNVPDEISKVKVL